MGTFESARDRLISAPERGRRGGVGTALGGALIPLLRFSDVFNWL